MAVGDLDGLKLQRHRSKLRGEDCGEPNVSGQARGCRTATENCELVMFPTHSDEDERSYRFTRRKPRITQAQGTAVPSPDQLCCLFPTGRTEGATRAMAKDGGLNKEHHQQLLPSKQMQLDYNAPVSSIRHLNGRHSRNSSGSELRDSPGPPFYKLPIPRCEPKKLDYNAPLLSIRRLNSRLPGNSSSTALRDNPGASHFNRLSADLSYESLRIPGAVPFVWELEPGRRKISHDGHNADMSVSQQCSADATAMDKQLPVYPKNIQSIGSICHKGSIEKSFSGPLPSYAVASSSARLSVAPSMDDDDDDDNTSSDTAFTTATDAFTTACGLSNDDLEGGPLVSQTSSDDRSFIMHRFLPAAHALAYDSPQTPSRRSPAGYLPSPLFHTRLRRYSPLQTPLSNFSAPVRSPPSPFLPLYGETHHEAQHHAPFKACGMFSFRFLNLFLCLHRDLCWSKQLKKSKARRLTRPSKLGDILCKDESSDDDQDFVARQVRVSAERKRARKMMEHLRPSVASKGSSLHQLFRSSEAETLNTTVSPSTIFNPGKNSATMPLFLEGKGFLGFPKERHLNDVSSETDGSTTCFETPRRSMSESKLAEMDTCQNEYVSSSYRVSSFFSRLHKPPNPGQRDPGVEFPYPRLPMGMIPPSKAPTRPSNWSPGVPSSALQQPNNHRNAETLTPEKKARPIQASSRRPSSPTKFFAAKKRPETESSAAILAPPLPKSPSDSWLWKAIPVKASKSSTLSEAEQVPLNQSLQGDDATWEAIVKESQIRRGTLRSSSEERSYHIPKAK